MNKHFIGYNNFIWFTGVVEDRMDPEKLGRVRVRCVGLHTNDKQILPTEDLPWSQVIMPVTSTGISGLGHSPSFLVEGTWVFGYHRDGKSCQEPMVIGTLPGKPIFKNDKSWPLGFVDAEGIYPKYEGEVDTNRLAVNDTQTPHLALELRKLVRKTSIATADFNLVDNADGSKTVASDGDTWDQPETPYAASYPFNHVWETESGHIKEWDDTKDAERIFESHRTGTSYEIHPDGTQTEIIKGDHYIISSAGRYALIEGQSDTTIEGRHKIYINKSGILNNHYDIQVGPNANINVQVDKGNINLVTVDGKINVNAGGDYNVKVKGNMTTFVEGDLQETIEGKKTSNTTKAVLHTGETFKVTANRIDLNE